MKSEIVGNQEVQKEREYPWLGISSLGMVVLFSSPNIGTVLNVGIQNNWCVGKHFEYFDTIQFTEFKGQVILSND